MTKRSPGLAVAVAACYGLACAGWVALARAVGPPVIAAAYQGRSLPALNRVFQRRIAHPLGHYLDLWSGFTDAVALAVLFHLGLVLLALALGRGGAGPSHPAGFGRVRCLSAFSAAFLLVTVLSGPRHDYVAFVEIWDAMRRGEDPWYVSAHLGYSLNAYGPLFNALAPLAWWNPLAPKLLFASAYLAFVTTFVRLGAPPRRGATVWLAGPFLWVEVAYFGHFDVLVAIACVLAVVWRRRGRDAASGVALGVGFLLKFLPLAVLPFLAVERARVRPRLLGAAAVVMAAGMALGRLAWGPSVFRPLGFARARPSALASVFRFLRGSYSPLRLVTDATDLDRYSGPAMLAAGAAVFLACQWRKATPETGAVASILTALLFYQVGFPQYQVLLFLLLAVWCRAQADLLAARPRLGLAVDAYLGWYTAFDLVYCYAGGVLHPGDPLAWLDEVAGLPSFVLGVLLLAGVLGAPTPRAAGGGVGAS